MLVINGIFILLTVPKRQEERHPYSGHMGKHRGVISRQRKRKEMLAGLLLCFMGRNGGGKVIQLSRFRIG